MALRHDPAGRVILVGGSGVVGRNLAPLLWELERRAVFVAARDPGRAAPIVEAVRAVGGEAEFMAYTVGGELDVGAAAIVGLVNDPSDHLLLGAVAAGIPFVDITRWTSRVALALGRLALSPPRAPVVFASGWMGGLLARVVRALIDTDVPIARVDGYVRYAIADASGANSVEYMDRLWVPFEVPHRCGTRLVEPFYERRVATIDGHATMTYRFDTPEQWSLPLAIGIPAAAVHLGFDSALAGHALWALVRLGVFRLFRTERYLALRQSLLRAKGAEHRSGARAAFRVDVTFADGSVRSRTVVANGQAHLTAVGAWLAMRQAIRAAPGVQLPEQDPDFAALFPVHLPAAGVTLLEER